MLNQLLDKKNQVLIAILMVVPMVILYRMIFFGEIVGANDQLERHPINQWWPESDHGLREALGVWLGHLYFLGRRITCAGALSGVAWNALLRLVGFEDSSNELVFGVSVGPPVIPEPFSQLLF